MKLTFENFISRIKKAVKTPDEKFYDAAEAYQIAKYNDRLTREELKEKMIGNLKKNIISDFKFSNQFLNITTYDGYREKLLLPEVAKYFRELNYQVDLFNEGNYENVNVLIINWQNLETFR